MKLYDVPTNSNSRKIRAIAFELDLRLTVVPVDMMAGQHKSPDFLLKNPNGKVPTLDDDGFYLWESNAIAIYLCSKQGRTDLVPTEPRARAEVDRWLFWQTAHLNTAVGKISWEKIYKAKLNLGLPDQAAIEAGVAEFNRFCAVLDGQLANNEFVTGKTMTVADFALTGSFGMRDTLNLDLSAFPNIKTWLSKIESRPSWIQAGNTQA